MDRDRFDDLTKRLARDGVSRRRLLRGLGGSLAGAVMSGFGLRAASAATGGNSLCAQWCHAQFRGAAAGQCTSDAAHGMGPCYGCTGPQGQPCAAGFACAADGTCQPLLGSGGGTCTADADCGGQSCCGGTCTDTTSDPANCGSCGFNCAALLVGYRGPYGCSGGFCCFELNGSCASNADCCDPSAVCSGKTRSNPIGFCCLPSGSACGTDLDCCSDACVGTCL
jgi:hypothetical protein